MRIRWKVFWLLAFISLAPLLVLRLNSRFSLEHLSQRISLRLGNHLRQEAQDNLGRLVENHARLLASRRQSLLLAVTLQAVAAAKLLAAPAPPPPPIDRSLPLAGPAAPPSDELTESSDYFRLLPDGSRQALHIDRTRLGLRLPSSTTRSDAADKLLGLFDPLRRIADEIGPLAHLQITVLPDGLAVLYPALQPISARSDPRQTLWYRAALASQDPVWTPPLGEPVTNRVAVAVSRRIDSPDGQAVGVAALFAPLDDLLASVALSDAADKHVQVLLVTTRPDASGRPALLMEAGQVERDRSRGWHAFVTPAPLTSPDAGTLASMAAAVAKGQAGTARLTYGGQVCLAAHAATGPNEALLEIVPLASIMAADRAVGADVAASLRRMYLFASLTLGVVMVVLVIASLTASRAVTRPILALTQAADRLAAGDFSVRIARPGRDEIGELGRMFNVLAPRLAEQVRLAESLALASEIQHRLLPAAPPRVPGLDLAAVSRYCDATGGDYFDFFPNPGGRTGRLGLVVGDVTGHGLEAALLMTTARALLRPRVARPGSPADVLADVNRELAADVYGTGRFMTLFYLELDPAAGTAVFARAGHDPALLYDPATGRFAELTARGIALGAVEDAVYETGNTAGLRPGQVLLIGSDGLWEAHNAAGEMFGKARTRQTLAAAADRGAAAVRDALLSALDAFRGAVPQEDDVTLVIAVLTDSHKETPCI